MSIGTQRRQHLSRAGDWHLLAGPPAENRGQARAGSPGVDVAGGPGGPSRSIASRNRVTASSKAERSSWSRARRVAASRARARARRQAAEQTVCRPRSGTSWHWGHTPSLAPAGVRTHSDGASAIGEAGKHGVPGLDQRRGSMPCSIAGDHASALSSRGHRSRADTSSTSSATRRARGDSLNGVDVARSLRIRPSSIPWPPAGRGEAASADHPCCSLLWTGAVSFRRARA